MKAPSKEHIQTWLPLAVLAVLVLLVGIYDNTFFSLSNFLE